jgi:hypothetical protein
MFERLSRLALQGARRVSPALAEDLAGEALLAWVELAERRPAKAYNLLEQTDAYITRWAEWRARNALQRWLREAHDELEDHGAAIQPATLMRYDHRGGPRASGEHVATERELYDLFHRGEAYAEPLDLIRAYEEATPAVQAAIRKRASGYSAAEIGSWTFARASAALAAAV